MRFVVYEVWTNARIIDAKDAEDAYVVGEPAPRDDLSLCNWHIVRVDDSRSLAELIGGLEYKQAFLEKK
jgi:hypothetical protein